MPGLPAVRRAAIFIAALLVVAGAALALVSLAFKKEPAVAGRLSVAASFYPLAHFCEKAGGALVDVFMITPAGADSHDFEPTPKDMKRIAEAGLFVYNGAGLDPWAERAAPSVSDAGVATLEMASGFTLFEVPDDRDHDHDHDRVHDHDDGPLDPHIWLDPAMAARQVAMIGDALAAADPANAAAYRAQAGLYAAELSALDKEFAAGLSRCRSRDLVVAHDAFGYLARRYGLNVMPVTGVFSGAEPSPRRIAEVARAARERSIKYIFFEPLSSRKISGVIAEAAGAEVLELNPLEGLTKEQEAAGEDYVSVMRSNLANLRKALGCQ